MPNGRASLLPGFGIYTRLTGWAVTARSGMLDPAGQLPLGLRGQHHLTVDARRRATGIALGHPPHADQRVGAGTEHQLLQAADPVRGPPPAMP